ncbi:MAG: hypothetical protein O7E52_21940 [Candidatus Poribacteria bacterium]|nr:hypothetical protein [Candidatus Poribacteria bacterium]
MRQHRTIYFNDARHYYLFVFEPPIRLEDAWRPIDEVAGTAVDTFIYGVSRADGLFYPSRVGMQFGEDIRPFDSAPYWRVWENMQSLINRGLDPLTVLIDRAHQKGMDFFASLRMGGYGGMDPQYALANGGRAFVHPEVRDHQFAVLKELATEYPVEGVELDFAAAPGGSPFWLRPEDVSEYTPVMTDFVRQVADMVRSRAGESGQIGARIYPTEELNRSVGLDVNTWLQEGLVDFVVPMVYAFFILDANMPIGWLVQAAHENDIAVYAMLQPYYRDESRRFHSVTHATPAMMRAAAANFWELGADGLYTWFLPWPLGDTERATLTVLGDPELVKEGDKHYFLRRSSEATSGHDYEAFLPLEIPAADASQRHRIPFTIADDTENDNLHSVQLCIGISNLVTADRLELRLNGKSLENETCRRTCIRPNDPYAGQWLEFDLEKVRPEKGQNVLEIALQERPAGFVGGVTIEDVEILVKYGVLPNRS